MATTTNFGWETPDDTDLVKDGAAAMRTLGNSIDTSFVDLKGGTTGQVLSKASGTDLDFTWVAQDDSNAIQNAIVDAKGDLIAATAADTPARLAVGTNGQVLTADSTASTGLAWATPSSPTNLFYAGKNKMINGDFRINQRNFTSNTAGGSFNFDRWFQDNDGGTVTCTPQTFTPGTAPVAGYEGSTFLRQVVASQSTTAQYAQIRQKVEGVRTFAGQTVTLSFWAKAASGTPKIAPMFQQDFGGGSANVNTVGSSVTLSTTWARYSVTVSIPSLSGKTIGTSNADFLSITLWTSAGSTYNSLTNSLGLQNNTFDIWGVQLEAGSTATEFQTASGSIGGELNLCQRYYEQTFISAATESANKVAVYSDSNYTQGTRWKVTKRATPTVTVYSSNGGTANRIRQISTNVNYTPASIADIGVDGFNIFTGIAQSNMMDFHYVASAEL